MFETKVFTKETIQFSVAPDPTSEDILRVCSLDPTIFLRILITERTGHSLSRHEACRPPFAV